MARNNSIAPRQVYHEDFLMASGDTPLEPFTNSDAGGGAGSPTLAPVNDAVDGHYALTHDTEAEAQRLTAYFGDQLVIPATSAPVMECRIKLSAIFTADQRFVCGFAGALNAVLDSITRSAWFRNEGADLALLIEGDDGTTDTNDQETDKDLVADTFVTLKVDMTNLDAVKYYCDGDLVGSIDCSAMTSSDLLQPYVEIQKDGGADVHALTMDYIHVEWNRS